MARIWHALDTFPLFALLILAAVFGLFLALLIARRRERLRRRLEAAYTRYERDRSEVLVHG